jgi:hypothetical protein
LFEITFLALLDEKDTFQLLTSTQRVPASQSESLDQLITLAKISFKILGEVYY